MKNSFIILGVLVIALVGNLSANKNLALYDFYVRDVDGNYNLISYLDYDFNNCFYQVDETCTYYHFKNNVVLPNKLTSEQAFYLSNYEPITLQPMLNLAQTPIKGYYYNP